MHVKDEENVLDSERVTDQVAGEPMNLQIKTFGSRKGDSDHQQETTEEAPNPEANSPVPTPIGIDSSFVNLKETSDLESFLETLNNELNQNEKELAVKIIEKVVPNKDHEYGLYNPETGITPYQQDPEDEVQWKITPQKIFCSRKDTKTLSSNSPSKQVIKSPSMVGLEESKSPFDVY